VCLKTRCVTKRDALELATLQYVFCTSCDPEIVFVLSFVILFNVIHVVKGGQNLPSLVRIGLTDLPNIFLVTGITGLIWTTVKLLRLSLLRRQFFTTIRR
jgi:hypothetical protein